MRTLSQWLPLLLAGFATIDLHAASPSEWSRMKVIVPQTYACYRAGSPLQIDGRISDAEWAHAPWTADFQDIEGAGKPRPRFRTRAKMLWDENFFYVAAELEELHIWGTLTNHDAVIFQDNDFEVFIDPEGDTHDYFEFEMNALNTTWDLLLKKRYIDGGPALNEWEIPGLRSAVAIDGTLNDASDQDRRWTLEIAFPWKSLTPLGGQGEGKRPRDGERWRVNFSRVEWQIDTSSGGYVKVPKTSENNWVWSPQGIIDMHRPEKWGYVVFSGAVQGHGSVTIDAGAGLRDALMGVYYAQREFRARHSRWATALEEIRSDLDPRDISSYELALTTSGDGFEVSGVLSVPGTQRTRWTVRQDGKLWRNGL